MPNFHANLTPPAFHAIVKLMNAQKDVNHSPSTLGATREAIDLLFSGVDKDVQDLARANESLVRESQRLSRQRSNPFAGVDEGGRSDPLSSLRHTMDENNFISSIYAVVEGILDGIKRFRDLAYALDPEPIHLFSSAKPPTSFEEVQSFNYEFATYKGAVSSFIEAVMEAERAPSMVVTLGRNIASRLDAYYGRVLHRHTVEGIQIHGDPISTDLAISIFENVDANGEIQDGVSPDEVSAYSISKAVLIARSLNTGIIGAFLNEPDELTEFFVQNLKYLWDFAQFLQKHSKDQAQKIRALSNSGYPQPRLIQEDRFNEALSSIKNLDPRNIKYKEKTGLMTIEERAALKFRNETIEMIVENLGKVSSARLIRLILERKAERRKFELEENSFYVCKIGAGNPFAQEAPGALSLVPGSKPNVNLDEIVGSGFDQVRAFIKSVESGSKWFDLFIATSPSKRADKNNVLLVGPMGCGKCVVDGTLVFTNQGLVSIGGLGVGCSADSDGYAHLEVEVLGLEGPRESSHFYDSGCQPTFKMETRHGFQIEGTNKHRVLVATDKGPDWKRLDEIQPGDYTAIVREGLPFSECQGVGADEGYLLGYWVGDGSSTQDKKRQPRYLRISVGTQDFPHFDKAIVPLIKRFWGTPRAYKDKRPGVNVYDVQILQMERSRVQNVLRECGKGADNKRVPERVLQSGKEAWKGFLQGLFDSDGSAYGSRVELASNSQGLIRTVQVMLTAFGIVAKVSPRRGRKSWRLFLYGENARVFYSEVGFRLQRKMEALAPILLNTTNGNYDIVPVSPTLWKAVKKSAGVLPRSVHKKLDAYTRRAKPSRKKLAELILAIGLEGGPEMDALRGLADSKWFWDKVVVAGATGESKPVKDLVVPQGHSFAAGGVMNHNTEILRAVASMREVISIFAQASDFLTCWKGEAEKNPKRLFEGGLKLQRESGKPVYFLIDEIDTVLNGDRGQAAFGGTNLATEFQVLMDGITTYPNLAVWGATNHPERIPMPLIRRFAKVIIVGELNLDHRVTLLKQFMGFLPISPKFAEGAWEDAGKLLDGAVGDIVRKCADDLWRVKMTAFVKGNPKQAESLVVFLNSEGKFDVSNFTSKQRQVFHVLLRNFVEVSEEDVIASIEAHLSNVAIQAEIATAKATYERSRRVLAGIL